MTLRPRRKPSCALTFMAGLAVSGWAEAAAEDPAPAAEQAAQLPGVVVEGVAPTRPYTRADSDVAGFGEQPIIEIPRSIQVLGRDLIDDQSVLSVSDLLENNVAGSTNSLARSTPFSSATLQLRGQNTAVFRDGLRDIDFGDIDNSALVNVDRVEVLKGPGGLVYGSGAPGGTVNIVTKRPAKAFEARIAATLGNRDTRIASADVSAPLGHGFGIRLTGEIERSDNFVDFAEIDRQNFSGALAWEQGAFSALLRYENLSSRDDNTMSRFGLPTFGTITGRDLLRIDRSTYLGEPAFDNQHAFGNIVYGEAAYAITPDLSVKLQGRRTAVNFEQSEVRTFGVVDPATFDVARTRARRLDLNEAQYNGRALVNWTFDTGPVGHQLTAGIEYFSFELAIDNRNIPNNRVPPIDVLAPVYLADSLEPFLGAAVPSRTTDRSREAFIADILSIGPLSLNTVLRYSNTKFDDGNKLNELLYEVGASYKLTERLAVFAGASTGFEANSTIAAERNLTGERFDPEFFRQVELGVKTDLLAGLTGTASIFELVRDDILVADPSDPDFLTQGGEETTRGVEIDLNWQPLPTVLVRGGYAYLDAAISKDTDPARDGQRRPGTPQDSLNGFASYRFATGALEGLRLGGGFCYLGAAFASVTNTLQRPAYTVANLNASYELRGYRLDVFVNNLFDEEYFVPRSDLQVTAGEPRLYGARLSYRF